MRSSGDSSHGIETWVLRVCCYAASEGLVYLPHLEDETQKYKNWILNEE